MKDGAAADADLPPFLRGGGSCARLILARDWTATLGPLEGWPQSLLTATAILLRSPVPMVMLWGEDGVMIYNDAYSVFAGGRHPELLGSRVREGWPEVAEFNDHVMRVGLAGGTLAYKDMELTLHRHDRPEQVFMNLDYSPVPGDDGQPAGVLAVVVETTERVAAERERTASEERLRFLDRLGRATQPLTEAAGVMAVTARLLGEQLGVAVCAYADVEPGQDAFTIRGDWTAAGASSIVGCYSLSSFGRRAENELRAGRPFVTRDTVTELGPEEADMFVRLGLGATVCMPLVKDGDLTALMAVHAAEPRDWTKDELAIVAETAERSWAHVERVRAEAALRDSEARYRSLFGSIESGFCLVEVDLGGPGRPVDYRVLEANPAFFRQTGFSEEIMGRWLREAAPELEEHWYELYGGVARTGEPVRREQGSEFLGRWFDVYAYRVGASEDRRVAILFNDITMRRAVESERDEARRLLETFVEAVPGVVYAKDREGRMLVANRGTTELIGKPPEAYLGRTDAEVLGDPEQGRAVMEIDRRIMESGVAEQVEETVSRPDGTPAIWFSTKVPLRDAEGRVVGLIGSSVDITARKEAETLLSESEERFRNMADHAPVMMWVTDPNGWCTYLNQVWYAFTGQSPEQALGVGWLQAIHPDDRAEAERIFLEANRDRVPFRIDYRLRRADGAWRWAIDAAAPRFGPAGEFLGCIGSVIDITDRKEAEEELRARTAELESLLVSAPLGIAYFDRAHRWVRINEELALVNGFPVAAHLGRRLEDLLPVNAGQVGPVLDQVFATGEAIRNVEVTGEVPHAPGQRRHWLVNYYPVRDADGAVTSVGTWVVDITERKEAEARAQEGSRLLETLNRAGAALSAELDLDRLLQRLTDAAVDLVGAQFGAFFHNILDESGERMHLFTLSGARRSDFEGMGGVRATGVFGPTFRNEGIIRSDDITADPRYGQMDPHRGMPPGHLEVRSYLGVPVISRSGEVLGGLLFGHPEPGRFTEVHERLMEGLAAQAAVAIDNARLFGEVQRVNETLERRVAEAVAERERVEEALRQSQKMEAVGQLTGGIAHDFNNMLAAVVGSLDLLSRRLGDADARSRRYVDAAMEGARRAAALTQRLLAFSRQQPLRPEPVRANRLVLGMSDLLRRSLGPTIRLETALARGLWQAFADPNQLENVLLNLALNARDAMPEGGRLLVSTGNARLTAEEVKGRPGLAAGDFVCIAVADSGTGMSPEVAERAFDPFFTTKPVGKGTGLGLSQVYGFVRQSGGHVEIESAAGRGTTVRFYLPRHQGPEAPEGAEEAGLEPLQGSAREVVLVVEDEEVVRRFAVEALGSLGYGVLEAAEGQAALGLLAARPEIRLLLTDIMMPGMDGRRLAAEARRRRPDLRVLFMTGYIRGDGGTEDGIEPGAHLLGKPFTVDALASKLREVLDGPLPAEGATAQA